MKAGRDLLARLAPVLACLGLLAVWQLASLALNNDSFPTALQAIRAVPSIPESCCSGVNRKPSL